MQSDHSLNAHAVPQPQRLSPPHLSRTIHLVFHVIYTFESDFCDMVTIISDDADDSLCSLRSRFLFLARLLVVRSLLGRLLYSMTAAPALRPLPSSTWSSIPISGS
jgi:hypothetical protein